MVSSPSRSRTGACVAHVPSTVDSSTRRAPTCVPSGRTRTSAPTMTCAVTRTCAAPATFAGPSAIESRYAAVESAEVPMARSTATTGSSARRRASARPTPLHRKATLTAKVAGITDTAESGDAAVTTMRQRATIQAAAAAGSSRVTRAPGAGAVRGARRRCRRPRPGSRCSGTGRWLHARPRSGLRALDPRPGAPRVRPRSRC